jgi:hypothetical protein
MTAAAKTILPAEEDLAPPRWLMAASIAAAAWRARG